MAVNYNNKFTNQILNKSTNGIKPSGEETNQRWMIFEMPQANHPDTEIDTTNFNSSLSKDDLVAKIFKAQDSTENIPLANIGLVPSKDFIDVNSGEMGVIDLKTGATRRVQEADMDTYLPRSVQETMIDATAFKPFTIENKAYFLTREVPQTDPAENNRIINTDIFLLFQVRNNQNANGYTHTDLSFSKIGNNIVKNENGNYIEFNFFFQPIIPINLRKMRITFKNNKLPILNVADYVPTGTKQNGDAYNSSLANFVKEESPLFKYYKLAKLGFKVLSNFDVRKIDYTQSELLYADKIKEILGVDYRTGNYYDPNYYDQVNMPIGSPSSQKGVWASNEDYNNEYTLLQTGAGGTSTQGKGSADGVRDGAQYLPQISYTILGFYKAGGIGIDIDFDYQGEEHNGVPLFIDNYIKKWKVGLNGDSIQSQIPLQYTYQDGGEKGGLDVDVDANAKTRVGANWINSPRLYNFDFYKVRLNGVDKKIEQLYASSPTTNPNGPYNSLDSLWEFNTSYMNGDANVDGLVLDVNTKIPDTIEDTLVQNIEDITDTTGWSLLPITQQYKEINWVYDDSVLIGRDNDAFSTGDGFGYIAFPNALASLGGGVEFLDNTTNSTDTIPLEDRVITIDLGEEIILSQIPANLYEIDIDIEFFDNDGNICQGVNFDGEQVSVNKMSFQDVTKTENKKKTRKNISFL